MIKEICGIKWFDLLWVTLEHLKRLFESLDDFIKGSAPLSDMLGLA